MRKHSRGKLISVSSELPYPSGVLRIRGGWRSRGRGPVQSQRENQLLIEPFYRALARTRENSVTPPEAKSSSTQLNLTGTDERVEAEPILDNLRNANDRCNRNRPDRRKTRFRFDFNPLFQFVFPLPLLSLIVRVSSPLLGVQLRESLLLTTEHPSDFISRMPFY